MFIVEKRPIGAVLGAITAVLIIGFGFNVLLPRTSVADIDKAVAQAPNI